MSAPTTHQHREDTRIVLRPVGSGLPLGLLALAVGTALVGAASLGLTPVNESPQLGQALLAFAFPLELIAVFAALWARDTLSATVFGLFSASWLTTGLWLVTGQPGATTYTSGVFQLSLVVCIGLIAVLALKAKPFIAVILGLSAGRLFFYGAYELLGDVTWYRASGYFAVAVVVVALYGAVAFILEDMQQRQVLPLFRRGPADTAFRGYEAQLDRLEAEPGIRQQL